MAKYQIRHEPTFCCLIGKALLWLWHKDFKFEAKEHIFYTGIDRTTEGSLKWLDTASNGSILWRTQPQMVQFKDGHSLKLLILKMNTASNGSTFNNLTIVWPSTLTSFFTQTDSSYSSPTRSSSFLRSFFSISTMSNMSPCVAAARERARLSGSAAILQISSSWENTHWRLSER